MPRRILFWAITLCAVAAAAWQAWALRWTCDDAFISFRYAQHFVEGHGLVFNLDRNEAPVEGYTNFAWTMLLALGMQLGCTGDAIETWSIGWGVLFHAGTVLLLAAVAWRASGGRALAPIAACGYAVLHHAASLAPAGLETALFVLLVTGLLRLCLAMRCSREAWLAGFLGVLLMMTRPDGALFCGMAGLFVAYDCARRANLRLLIGYLVPFLVVFAPYLLWRHSYYGYWVPNTFFAKSAGDPYPGQGLRYVWEFAKCYWVLLPVVVLPWYWAVQKPDLLAGLSQFLGRRPWLAILAFFAPYLGFVIWVGGDFMFGRFLLPILPVLLLSLDFACLRWRARWLQPAFAAALVAGLLLRAEPDWLGKYDNPNGFSDNRTISMKEFAPGVPFTEAMRVAGHYLHDVFDGLDVRIAIAGSHANLAYRSNVPVAIEVAAGLTDARIAHTPVAKRTMVGHERGYGAFVDYLLRERQVQFVCDLSFHTGEITDAYRSIVFPVIPLRLGIYDRVLMRELRRRDPHIVCQDFEVVLDQYLAAMAGKPKEQVRTDFAAFRSFYFDHNDDPERRRRFEEFLK